MVIQTVTARANSIAVESTPVGRGQLQSTVSHRPAGRLTPDARHSFEASGVFLMNPRSLHVIDVAI